MRGSNHASDQAHERATGDNRNRQGFVCVKAGMGWRLGFLFFLFVHVIAAIVFIVSDIYLSLIHI